MAELNTAEAPNPCCTAAAQAAWQQPAFHRVHRHASSAIVRARKPLPNGAL